MIDNVIDGFHSTVFCYGQTGSGKTYSMDGYKYRKTEKGLFLPIFESVDKQEETSGLVQRSIRDLVQKIEPLKKDRNITLNVSFLQIYNEKIYDLLNPGMFKRNKGDGLI